MMASFVFEGRDVPFEPGDTVASALYRDGVRTFSRSTKYHRRRGLYCGTGDCPNCLMTVDALPAVHACTTACSEGMRVARSGGWPSAERDLLHVTDSLHRVMPVGFYYKTFIRPWFAWPVAERVIRRATGLGALPEITAAGRHVVRHEHVDVLVIGGGIAGLDAARAAAAAGSASVLLCDEGRIGGRMAPGPVLDRLRSLETEVRTLAVVTVLEGFVALGVYEDLH
ncbi:MAG: 2Fe-2S iron-sulfur cluster-binding protein, partial [Actinomycetota bacterium]